MRAQASDDVDVIITEIGGTVGDIESQPFLEAAREVRRDLGAENCMFVHVSLVPYIAAAHELKTKPTQHSVMMLRQLGISPDALVLRSDRPLNQSIKDKISLMCDVDSEGVVNCVAPRASMTCRRPCSTKASTPMSCASSACRSTMSIGTSGRTCWSVCTTRSMR